MTTWSCSQRLHLSKYGLTGSAEDMIWAPVKSSMPCVDFQRPSRSFLAQVFESPRGLDHVGLHLHLRLIFASEGIQTPRGKCLRFKICRRAIFGFQEVFPTGIVIHILQTRP